MWAGLMYDLLVTESQQNTFLVAFPNLVYQGGLIDREQKSQSEKICIFIFQYSILFNSGEILASMRKLIPNTESITCFYITSHNINIVKKA